MAKLEYMLRGIKKSEAAKQPNVREHLPVTPTLLLKMKRMWELDRDQTDKPMLWVACCIAFFAFLRVGELTVPDDNSYDPVVHLSMGDIAISDSRTPSAVRIHIKQLKTDRIRKGIDLFVGKTSSQLCPVSVLLKYLRIQGSGPGPLFQYQEGHAITRARFASEVRSVL